MIRRLRIIGFKRFADQSLELAPLTVLCGLNGTGKTSVIHALLLAREAAEGGATVQLNGPFGLELGTAQDVRNWDGLETIEINLEDDEMSHIGWLFSAPKLESLHLDVTEPSRALPAAFSGGPRAFTYLCAERLGPRSVLGSSARPVETLEVGERGQYCAQVIEGPGERPLEYPERHHPDSEEGAPQLLKYEVERWLSQIARPTELTAERFSGTSVTALKFRAPGGDWVRAPNMGFGVTYALPVILAGLIAKKDGLLVVENPEAHLHPAGQSRVGVFLAWLAARGVQIVVETHSDHVLNGIRRAVGEHRMLSPRDALVHYFDTGEGDLPRVTPLQFTATGGVSDWPAGFFDQYQIDIAALSRVRRTR